MHKLFQSVVQCLFLLGQDLMVGRPMCSFRNTGYLIGVYCQCPHIPYAFNANRTYKLTVKKS